MNEANRREHGNMLVLGIGVSTFILALVLMASSVSAVYLDAKRLTALTDQALWDATGTVCRIRDRESLDDESRPLLDPGCVEDEFVRRLTAESSISSLGGFSDIAVADIHHDGRVITVRVRAHSQPPFLPWGIIPAEGIPLEVASSTRGFAQF
ncbi:hypothetical protein [Actinomyces vulturis]|uniref:hypothetical protein n=1 Tax=Actinomyces vulturis TaxID=1857645 RepID=UPI00159EDDDF|nr:hypothetical protein [Actinomyces vulturis]